MSSHHNESTGKLTRRSLDLQSFEDVLKEARLLERVGYHRAGTWSLGQVCEHLALFMNQSLDGFPPTPFYLPLMRPFFRMMYFGKIMRKDKLPAKLPTLEQLKPDEWSEDGKAIAPLEKAIARIQSSDAQFVPSPLFGNLTAEQWRNIHLWHCQHHLEFLIPAAKNSQTESAVA